MREDIYNVIKTRIVNLEYKPNESLTETAIAKEFEVSRTPIREIFISLACENFVTITPGNGIRVSDINLQGLHELISYRIILEKGAARLMGLNATPEDLASLCSLREYYNKVESEENVDEMINCDTQFHQITRKAARNSLLDKNLETVQLQFTRIHKLIGHKPARMLSHLDSVIESIENKDVEMIESCMVGHVYNFVKIIKQYFKII
ncbi:MAG: GntR family transcriptional regulator [Syntrophobacteraceae bacterium]|nr:GntR family transcriptional regulator [Desulfobacteraceae bacterium]